LVAISHTYLASASAAPAVVAHAACVLARACSPDAVTALWLVLTAHCAVDGRYTLSKLRYETNGETRTVSHYWYTAWPDHGVPEDASGNMETEHVRDMLFPHGCVLRSTQPQLQPGPYRPHSQNARAALRYVSLPSEGP